MTNSDKKSAVLNAEWMDLKAVQRYACISERTVREWLHRAVNPLPAVRVGTKILIRKSVFDEWLEAHPLVPAESLDVSSTVNEIMSEVAGAR